LSAFSFADSETGIALLLVSEKISPLSGLLLSVVVDGQLDTWETPGAPGFSKVYLLLGNLVVRKCCCVAEK
jgi:hypothetical protein